MSEPRFPLDPVAAPGRDTPPGLVTTALVVGGGFLVGGPFGLGVAAVAILVWRRAPDWLGPLLVGLLGLAALGSVVGAWPGPESLRQSFADDRPLAAAGGLGAGVALLVAVARAARTDRALSPTIAPPAATDLRLTARLAPYLPFVGVAVLAGAMSLAFAPDALSSGAQAAAAALRAGEGFVRTPGGPASFHHPPLALVVGAIFPHAQALLLAGIAGATAACAAVVGDRLAGSRAGIVTGTVVAVSPLTWLLRLPAALAVLLVLLAVLVGWPDRLTPTRAAASGGLLVLAALARPECILLVPVMVVGVAVWPGNRGERARRTGAALLGLVAVTGIALWLAQVHSLTGGWWPA